MSTIDGSGKTSDDTSDRRWFISHAGADRAWAECVGWQLFDAGHQVELDYWDWGAGDNFILKMNAALERGQLLASINMSSLVASPCQRCCHCVRGYGPRLSRPSLSRGRGTGSRTWITWSVDCATDAVMGGTVTPGYPSREAVLAALRAAVVREGPFGLRAGLPGPVARCRAGGRLSSEWDRGTNFLGLPALVGRAGHQRPCGTACRWLRRRRRRSRSIRQRPSARRSGMGCAPERAIAS
ncbi:toll/interleukin-1 receptor domain-containing protein [Streptomyces sp. NPDC058676]|uniref:toll/interleukin-1 receptor domain-containing protein n=1 Tax=unclassified Streptomyces TaxID=2593676 RepID=UPI00364BF29A